MGTNMPDDAEATFQHAATLHRSVSEDREAFLFVLARKTMPWERAISDTHLLQVALRCDHDFRCCRGFSEEQGRIFW